MSLRSRPRVVEAHTRKKTVVLRAVRVLFERDPDPDASYLDQHELSERRAVYESGQFFFVSARAEADVVIEGILQTLESGGFSGVESDSDEEYIDAIAADEWAGLRGVLKAVGVSTDQLPLEVDPKWIEWRM